jgi:hypothetical protein
MAAWRSYSSADAVRRRAWGSGGAALAADGVGTFGGSGVAEGEFQTESTH